MEKNCNEYYEYMSGEEFYVLIDQIYIDPSLIVLGEFEESITFPWHGKSYNDFRRLLLKLNNYILRYGLHNKKSILKRKYRDIYKAFFQNPIKVTSFGDKYLFHSDGRHRITVAKDLHINIPIQIIDTATIDNISYAEYCKQNIYSEWQF